jgi:thiol:disulfide interchange protein
MEIDKDVLDKLIANYQKPEDLIGENGLLKQLTKALVERAMEAELTTHLGYEKHDPVGYGTAAQFHWMSDRAARLQLESLDTCFSPDALPTQTTRFDRLVRYHTQFDRAFHRTLNTLLKLRAARQKEQIGFELAKQGAAAEAARAQHRDRQFALAELREQRAMQAEERAARSEQRQIEKSERDAAHVAAKIATQTAKKELFDADWEAHALMNAPIPGVGYTQVQKDAFREVLKQTNG